MTLSLTLYPDPDPHPKPYPNVNPKPCAPRQHYDVELVVTTFEGPLWESMRLVHGTDVVLGMHGAGLTNLLWLQRVRCLLQGRTAAQLAEVVV